MRQFKTGCLRVGRMLKNTNRTITGKQTNVEFKKFTKTVTVTIDAYTGAGSADAQKGRFAINLSIGNFMDQDNIEYIKDNYKTFNILSCTIRGQIFEIYKPFYRGIAVQSDPTTQNVAMMQIGNNITPRVYTVLQYNADSPIPPGASGTVGTDASDASFLDIEGQWKDHPRAKQLLSKKPFQIYWNSPTYARGKKHSTAPLNIDGSDSLPSYIMADSNQQPVALYFYWADLPRYSYSATTNSSRIRMNLQFHIFIKLQDSTKWTATQ